jgi:3-oxoacyl-[acyl-carrier-protein] synthase-1
MRGQGSVFAVGARTPIGLDAKQTALLLRSGIPAITAAPLATKDGAPVTMAFDATLDPYSVGEARSGELASAALREIAGAVGPGARGLRLRCVLAFPEPRPGQKRSEVNHALAALLRRALAETFGDPPVDVTMQGSAGLAYVLPEALTRLAMRECDAVLVGGVHSDYDPLAINALDVSGRLFSPDNVDGVVPGESAAFALIARDDFGHSVGLKPLCRVLAVASETSEITPYDDASALDASALASVFRSSCSVLPDELKVGWGIGDHSFESFRIRELYSALSRTNKQWCPPIAIDAPAQRIGQLGAAALPLGLVLASEMYRRSFAPTPCGLLFAGSDGGERGAILVGSV